MITYFAKTHPGLKRQYNEDCYGANEQLGLWLVADGVGGHACGDVASEIANTTINQEFANGKKIIQCIEAAHRAILDEIKQSPEKATMGCTVVAAVIKNKKFEIAWVGDSRAYFWDGSLSQLTTDHTVVAELVLKGVISAQEARVHPERHVITQSLGVSEKMQLNVGFVRGVIEDGQQILLCSDGLTDEVSDPLIAVTLRKEHAPQGQVEALMADALTSGGKDNITIVSLGKNLDSAPKEGADFDNTQKLLKSTKGKNVGGAITVGLFVLILVVAWWFIY